MLTSQQINDIERDLTVCTDGSRTSAEREDLLFRACMRLLADARARMCVHCHVNDVPRERALLTGSAR